MVSAGRLGAIRKRYGVITVNGRQRGASTSKSNSNWIFRLGSAFVAASNFHATTASLVALTNKGCPLILSEATTSPFESISTSNITFPDACAAAAIFGYVGASKAKTLGPSTFAGV